MTMSTNAEKTVATEEVTDRVLTVPNVISFIRLLLVPVFFVLLLNGERIFALILFSIAAATDFLDGQIARRTHSVSKLGKLLDPAVDTVLMFSGVLGTVLIGELPVWIAVLVIAREAFLLIGGGVLIATHDVRVAVIYPGKVATTLLFVGFAGMMLGAPVISGLSLVDVSWLPGFSTAPVACWIWFVYVGLILQIGVTIYYCVVAWHGLVASRESERTS